MNTCTKASRYILIIGIVLSSCIKDKDYDYRQVYDDALKSLSFTFSAPVLPADGSSRCTITVTILPGDTKDSINIAALNLSMSASNGTFVENGTAAINIIPTYKLDTVTYKKILTAIVTLQSSTRSDTSKITIKYLGVETYKNIPFLRTDPVKIKLSVSSLHVAPNFITEDTISAQLTALTGLPSLGTPVEVKAFDSIYKNSLGVFRQSATKTNAFGNCTFFYDLGDTAINRVNYLGTVHLVGYTGPLQAITDTISVYSRN